MDYQFIVYNEVGDPIPPEYPDWLVALSAAIFIIPVLLWAI